MGQAVFIAVASLFLLAACASQTVATSRGKTQACGAKLDKVAKVASLSIAYRQYGPHNGPSMVLLAGTGQQLVDWPPALIKALAGKGYRVTVFDNRDIGCSTHIKEAGVPAFGEIISAMGAGKPAPVAYTLETLADDTRGLMDALGIHKAHIVGVSQGAIVAEMFAAKYADRTLSLSAIAPNSGNRAIPVPADAKRFAGLPPTPPESAPLDTIVAYKIANTKALQSKTYPRSDAELRSFAIMDAQRSYDPDAAARQSAAALVTPDLRPRLKTISVPTVVIQGDQDPLIPKAMAEEVANSIPNAHLVIIAGMGHDLPDAATSQLVTAITSAAHS